MKYCKDCVCFDECKTTGRTVEFAVDDGACLDFDERKPQTNADRIRAMSDEEMAKRLYEIGYDGGWFTPEGTLEWLQKPAEGE